MRQTLARAPTSGGSPAAPSFASDSFRTVVVGLDGSERDPTPPLPAPASLAEITNAETRLGLALPHDIKQLYGEVADGGFGPSDGLASLDEIVERYRQLTGDPQGEGGQSWPEHLLPINLSVPGVD